MTNPNDISNKTISELFYKQIKQLTMKTNLSLRDKMKTMDIQFSDHWIKPAKLG